MGCNAEVGLLGFIRIRSSSPKVRSNNGTSNSHTQQRLTTKRLRPKILPSFLLCGDHAMLILTSKRKRVLYLTSF